MLRPPAAGGAAELGQTAQTERACCEPHEAGLQPTLTKRRSRAAQRHSASGCQAEHRMHARPLQRCVLLLMMMKAAT